MKDKVSSITKFSPILFLSLALVSSFSMRQVSAATPASKAYATGHELAKNHKPAEALPWYSKAIALDSKFAQAYVDRGAIYMSMQKFEPAIADLSKGIALNPRLTRAYEFRAHCYIETDDIKRAIDDLTMVIKKDPLFAPAYFNRSLAYDKLGMKSLGDKDRVALCQLDQKKRQIKERAAARSLAGAARKKAASASAKAKSHSHTTTKP